MWIWCTRPIIIQVLFHDSSAAVERFYFHGSALSALEERPSARRGKRKLWFKWKLLLWPQREDDEEEAKCDAVRLWTVSKQRRWWCCWLINWLWSLSLAIKLVLYEEPSLNHLRLSIKSADDEWMGIMWWSHLIVIDLIMFYIKLHQYDTAGGQKKLCFEAFGKQTDCCPSIPSICFIADLISDHLLKRYSPP